MNKEFKTYLLLMAVLLFFWLNGSVVDSALWFHATYQTPDWVVRNLSVFWLLFNQALAPLLIVIVLKPKWNTVIAFLAAGCWGSLAWDLLYGLLTRGTMIFDIPHWFDLGDLGFVIGFVGAEVWIFHVLRFLAGLVLLVWLYRRTRTETAVAARSY